MKIKKNSFLSNLKSISFAIFIALIIRSFIAEPFNIPSGSMKPNLLVGDFIFVSKWSYGYSKHSLPFSLPLIPNKILSKIPDRGDIVVFKTPEDNRTDYIKRVIGLPGDKIKIINGNINLNGKNIARKKMKDFFDNDKNTSLKRIRKYKEFHDTKSFDIIDIMDNGIADNTQLFEVPDGYFFVMGDNRDNSQDSRFIGLIPKNNLVGRAEVVCVSFDTEIGSFLKIWTWFPALRKDRLFISLRPKSN